VDQVDHGDHDPPWWTRSVQDHCGPPYNIFLMLGVGSGEGDGASVGDLCDKTLGEETVGLSECGGSYVGKGGGYALSKTVGSRISSRGEKVS